ncbi:hypothetical protein Tco_1497731 [Tanacetum coccineum]
MLQKGLLEKIDIVYQDAAKEVTGEKTVKVFVKVGKTKTSTANKVNEEKLQNDGFTEVVNKKNEKQKSKPYGGQNKPSNEDLKRTNTVYQPKPQQVKNNNEKRYDYSFAQKGTKIGTESTPNKDGSKEKINRPSTKKDDRKEYKFYVLGRFDNEGEMLEIEGMVNREKLLIDKEGNDDTCMEIEDVFTMNDGMAQEMNEGDIKGKGKNVLQDC